MPNPSEAWLQRQDESPSRYRAFVLYRDSGVNRSIRQAVELFYADTATPWTPTRQRRFEGFSTTFEWVDRALAWDLEQQSLELAKQVSDRKKSKERRLNYARLLVNKALSKIKDLTEKDLTVDQALRYLQAGLDGERLELGEVTDRAQKVLTGPEGAPLPHTVHVFREVVDDSADEAGKGTDGDGSGD
jgi:hypothetical protein